MIKLDQSIGNNFCYAPWTNIHINPQGTYKTCCGGVAELADLRVIPIQQVVESQELLDIKNAIANNQEHTNCNTCLRQEKMSSISERSWYNDIAENQTIDLKSIDQQYLQNLDIRWSNTCNLSCTYCGHDASSQWALIKKIPVERLDYTDTMSSILRLLEENKNTLKNLGLLGGEPLLQKENDLLLDVIDANVHINVITNLSTPIENNRIFKKLLSKNRVVWDISFETIGDRFEYVRHGAKWEVIIKNIRILQDAIKDKPGHLIGAAGVYSIYNATNLSEVHEYFADNNLPDLRWNELNFPNELAVIALPQRFRELAVIELESSIKYNKLPRQKKFLQDMANNIKSLTSDKDNCNYLYDWHQQQEQLYWPNFPLTFSNLWPEYKD